MPLQARAGQEGRARLSREEVRQAPRGRWKPGTAARPDTAVWNGAGFWQSGGCRRVTTATPEWLGWVERLMEAATRDAASVCFASACRADGADRIQRNQPVDTVACWWRMRFSRWSDVRSCGVAVRISEAAPPSRVRRRASARRRPRQGLLRSRSSARRAWLACVARSSRRGVRWRSWPKGAWTIAGQRPRQNRFAISSTRMAYVCSLRQA